MLLWYSQNRADAAVGTNLGVDRDPHVQPLVTVDDVVAGKAHDRVAAVTAQDDVACAVGDGAGSERGELRVSQAKNTLQARDARDAFLGEAATLVAFRPALSERERVPLPACWNR